MLGLSHVPQWMGRGVAPNGLISIEHTLYISTLLAYIP